MITFPEFLEFQIADFIDWIVDWVLVTFNGLFDFIALIISNLFNLVEGGLSFIPWWIIIILVVYLGKKYYTWVTGIVLGLMLFSIGMFGYWDSMIYTIAIVIISVVVSFLVGLPLGILMAKSQLTEKILKPILDAMQTMPSFVYLIPAIMLFGLGRVPAVFATTIYAVPPLIRLTYLGLKGVDKEVVEAGKAFGSTRTQMLFKIELPQALATIMTGVNQTTMMAMAMVVISSMVGAEGLGEQVLIAIRRLEVGRGFQAGFAVVFLAIVLDRIMQGVARSFEGGEMADE